MRKEKLSAGDIIGKVAERSGITKKLAAEVVRELPEVIRQGLLDDGEAKVRGLGTFRLKKVAAKKGRNPKTGEEVLIPPHDKLVFLPEESFRQQANEDFRLLGIKVLEEEVDSGQQSAVSGSSQFADRREEPEPVATTMEKATALSDDLEPGTSETIGTTYPEPGTRNPEPETTSKKRNYWLIPVVIVIVAALSVVFYWRNFYPGKDDRNQKTEESQRSVVSGQHALTSPPGPLSESEMGKRESEGEGGEAKAAGGQQSEQVQEPEPRNQEPNEQVPELNTQTLNLKTNLETAIVETHLFQLAREVYGNPFLWVLIYRANHDKIKDPDLAVTGDNIVIPSLEGTPKKLSHNDSLAVSDGYRLVYEYYRDKGDARAEEFRLVMEKYKP